MADSGIDDLYREIFRRKSVRRFEHREIDKTLMEKIRAGAAAAFPLTDTPAVLQVLQAREAGISFGGSPVLSWGLCKKRKYSAAKRRLYAAGDESVPFVPGTRFLLGRNGKTKRGFGRIPGPALF